MPMSILRLVIFVMAGVTIAGTLVLVALLTPSLNNAMGVIGASAVGFGLAIPIAIVVSNKIGGNTA